MLEVKNLKKYFTSKKGMLHAVDDLSFSIEQGKTLGIVGESGCGKSTTGRAVLRLHEPTSGEVLFQGKDITKISSNEMKSLRPEMQMIFQDPFASLNPRKSVGEIIGEPLRLHKLCKNNKERQHKVLELMETVGLTDRLYNSYPHELDGGRRQRIGIARALAMNPKFIVCDEPVSALDVSIQAQILNLLKELQAQRGLTYMFITHDLSVVNYFSDHIMVMYLGKMVEYASAEDLFSNPTHPYTKALLSAIPVPDIHQKTERILLKGEITSPINPKPGCRFAPRCNYATETCFKEEPPVVEVSSNHQVACNLNV
ncbi:peptide ABC transporter ATP-binding protein [Candidatus Epulonipiscium fishelsonii]|uniref:Peptide ABC transporter ATP-binding protein n=1 Tax=Candidatus Epulonipiscium fishelsonii TaxID=77094 RepID=A0ACC8XFG9_9FIRM|nr:peptide ABC transporter ATP-binding protein [Epulopiscium sp. SCG-B05WGA-EpuloA1]ONI42102.1 peptide ABC transporter ATP-binding protein [Epulopiscium sp. SCG-B11WGA-EpuloA1]